MTITVDLTVISAICGLILSVWSVAGIVYRPLKAIKKQYQAVSDGMVVILHFRLNRECLRVQHKKCMTLGERQDLEDIFNAYAALGGNGTGKQLYLQTMQLPVCEGKLSGKENENESTD